MGKVSDGLFYQYSKECIGEMKKKKRVYSGARARKNKRTMIITGIAAGAASLFVLGMILWVVFGQNSEVDVAQEDASIFEASVEPYVPETVSEYINENIISHIVNGGKAVSQALSERPATVEMTAENRATFAKINDCLIVDSSKVKIDVTSDGIPKSDDKYYYLFQQATYEDNLSEDAEPIAKIYKGDDTSFTINLNKGGADSRLFSKYSVGVKLDGKYTAISHPRYITNPGACAGYSYGGMSHKSIKGILPDPLRIGELADLGVEYATYNMPLSHILTTSGGIAYSYGGVTYHFNAGIINNYDDLFRRLNNMGIDVAAIILNDASVSAFPEITHPDARSGSTAPYRMFNANTESGVKALAAEAFWPTAIPAPATAMSACGSSPTRSTQEKSTTTCPLLTSIPTQLLLPEASEYFTTPSRARIQQPRSTFPSTSAGPTIQPRPGTTTPRTFLTFLPHP